MQSTIQVETDRLAAVRRLQLITIGWMLIEVLVSIGVAVRAHSIALLAFGGDSAIELLSAFVVFIRFSDTRLSERTAARLTALLLYSLAVLIACASALSLMKVLTPPKPTFVGMALLVAAATIMPLLARRKRMVSHQMRSASLAADAAQSSICAWLAWIGLAGLLLNAAFGLSWADPLAALAICPLVLKEARDAWNQKACQCC